MIKYKKDLKKKHKTVCMKCPYKQICGQIYSNIQHKSFPLICPIGNFDNFDIDK